MSGGGRSRSRARRGAENGREGRRGRVPTAVRGIAAGGGEGAGGAWAEEEDGGPWEGEEKGPSEHEEGAGARCGLDVTDHGMAVGCSLVVREGLQLVHLFRNRPAFRAEGAQILAGIELLRL